MRTLIPLLFLAACSLGDHEPGPDAGPGSSCADVCPDHETAWCVGADCVCGELGDVTECAIEACDDRELPTCSTAIGCRAGAPLVCSYDGECTCEPTAADAPPIACVGFAFACPP